MPRAPQYDAPQEAPRPLGMPDLSSVVSGDILGGRAREEAETGRALTTAGMGLADVAVRMKEREDADVVMRAETSLKDSYLGYEQDVRKSKQGRFAKDLTADTKKWWGDQLQKHSQNLQTEDQRRLFMSRVQGFRQQSLESMSTWEAHQLDKSHDEAWLADKNVTTSNAAANPTPTNVDSARLDIERLNKYQAVRKGWEGAQLEAENLKDKTNLHKQVLQGLALNNPSEATKYFATYKDEIDGSLHAELGKFAQQASANHVGETTADEIFKTMGPKYDTQPAELDKMEAKLREQLKGNEYAMKTGVAALRDRVSAFDKGRQEREQSTEATVWRAVARGATPSQVKAMPEYLQLKGDKQASIVDHMESRAYTKSAQAEAQKTRDGFAAYLKYSNPEVLSGMSEDQIVNLTGTLGDTLGGHLMEKKRSLGGKVVEARMDQDDFNHVAQEAGLRPFDPKKNEDEKAALGELKYRVEQLVDTEQARLKRPLQREEKLQLMRREMDNRVLTDRFFGITTRNTPAILLPASDLPNAYVTVQGRKFPLASVPAADRAEIIRERRKRSLPVTEQSIAETYLAAHPKVGGK